MWGGDKALPYFDLNETNPFLGWRGIRITLDHPELFSVQVRALLRANDGLNNLKIMLPMISSVHEVTESFRLIKKAHQELVEEGYDLDKPTVGVMIEVPSAVYQAERLAQLSDFLSVGSNDLIQYLLAVDRNNARVARLFDGLHPAVLRALTDTVKCAHGVGKTASICGELASDPVAVVALLGMGFNTLSMSSASLPRIKWVIRNITAKKAKILLEEALAMDNAAAIRCHFEEALQKAGLGGLIRAGKK